MLPRAAGVLLHVTSLPAPFGIGDLGPTAYRFVDALAAAGQRYWQMLPLVPTEVGRFNSPYLGTSAFAANPLLVSPEALVADGWLTADELREVPDFPSERVDFPAVTAFKEGLLAKAYARFRSAPHADFARFAAENADWLDDYALFVALRAHFAMRSWVDWPRELRDRDPAALRAAAERLDDAVGLARFGQFVFARQWTALRAHCEARGVQLIGDMPIYVDHDSVDVWAHPEYFKLDAERRPTVVSGVPPDYFSRTGQLWGNPVYRWDALAAHGYDFWFRRIARNLALCDIVRIDHFRGFVAYWEVPAGEKTAINGYWVEAPAVPFFEALTARFPNLPIIAEDLGEITPDVIAVMRRFGLPGMKVLLFGFAGDPRQNPHPPHNHERHCIVYTGTHDNCPARGWLEHEASPEERERLAVYLGHAPTPDAFAADLVRLAHTSPAALAIVPLQDLLGLGREARMNTPAVAAGNWQWRARPAEVERALGPTLARLTKACARA